MINVLTARRVSALSDTEINALLDAHLFGHSPLCLGHSADDGTGVWRCQWCQAIDDRAVASRIFDMAFGHYRESPHYTIAEIVVELQRYDWSTWIVYEKALYAQILGESAQGYRRTPHAAFTQVVLHLSDRCVGVAALTALGIIDEQGYLRKYYEI